MSITQIDDDATRTAAAAVRLRQLWGMNGIDLDAGQLTALSDIAALCPKSLANADWAEQPLRYVTTAELSAIRTLTESLPQTTPLEHWLHLTEFGPYPYVGV